MTPVSFAAAGAVAGAAAAGDARSPGDDSDFDLNRPPRSRQSSPNRRSRCGTPALSPSELIPGAAGCSPGGGNRSSSCRIGSSCLESHGSNLGSAPSEGSRDRPMPPDTSSTATSAARVRTTQGVEDDSVATTTTTTTRVPVSGRAPRTPAAGAGYLDRSSRGLSSETSDTRAGPSLERTRARTRSNQIANSLQLHHKRG